MTFPSKRQAMLEEVDRYNKAHWFLEQLMRSKGKLSSQQYSTLKGQALSGDLEGAWKGLKKLTRGW